MTYEYVPKLIRAAINNDRKNVESISLLIGRKLKKEDPEFDRWCDDTIEKYRRFKERFMEEME